MTKQEKIAANIQARIDANAQRQAEVLRGTITEAKPPAPPKPVRRFSQVRSV